MMMRRAESMPALRARERAVREAKAATRAESDESDETTADGFVEEWERGDGVTECEVRVGGERAREEGGFDDARPTVLVVDDCAVNLRAVTKVLQATFTCDVRVELSSDGRKGIQQYEALQNDPMCDLLLVVIDYNMPECNGVTAAQYMRALDGKPATRGDAGANARAKGDARERVAIVMYTTELEVLLPALVDGTIDDRLPKVCTRERFSKVLVKHLKAKHLRFVLPEWRTAEGSFRRFSCNDKGNIESEIESFGTLSLDTIDEETVLEQGKVFASAEKRGAKRSRGSRHSRTVKTRKGDDGEMIVLQESSTHHEDGRTRGVLNGFTKSVKQFLAKRSQPTVRAQRKEVKRVQLRDLFESGAQAHQASIRARSLDVVFPRYSM